MALAACRSVWALATPPQVLLLDEPLAGMGQAEAERMAALRLRLKQDHAIMLVEHDMDAVFTLADRLTVMVNGQVIASGTSSPATAKSGSRGRTAPAPPPSRWPDWAWPTCPRAGASSAT